MKKRRRNIFAFFGVLGYNHIMIIAIIIASSLLAIDLVSKAIIYGKAFEVIPNLLSVYSVSNTGAGFGIFEGDQIFLITTTFIILSVGIFAYFKLHKGRKSKLLNIGCAFVFSGALGNLCDRIFLGYVRDFIKFDFLDFVNFPICNFADLFLNVGMVLLFVYFIFFYKGNASANSKS